MNIVLAYHAQIRQAAGVETERLEVPAGTDLHGALRAAADLHGEAFRGLVLSGDLTIRPGIIVLVNSAPVPRGARRELSDGDEIRLFSPVAGG